MAYVPYCQKIGLFEYILYNQNRQNFQKLDPIPSIRPPGYLFETKIISQKTKIFLVSGKYLQGSSEDDCLINQDKGLKGPLPVFPLSLQQT